MEDKSETLWKPMINPVLTFNRFNHVKLWLFNFRNGLEQKRQIYYGWNSLGLLKAGSVSIEAGSDIMKQTIARNKHYVPSRNWQQKKRKNTNLDHIFKTAHQSPTVLLGKPLEEPNYHIDHSFSNTASVRDHFTAQQLRALHKVIPQCSCKV